MSLTQPHGGGSFGELLDFISTRCPNARIVVLGNFWQNEEVDVPKREAAEAREIPFVELSDLGADEAMHCGLGVEVSGDDGVTHMVEHEGVAGHPGDAGMRAIAERVLEALQIR